VKNENNRVRCHRGSSPSFQGSDQGLHEREIGLRSTEQSYDESPYIPLLDQQADQEEERDEQEPDTRKRKGTRNGQESLNRIEFRQNQDDENHWQDDGGES
jgi:hypothetical protein